MAFPIILLFLLTCAATAAVIAKLSAYTPGQPWHVATAILVCPTLLAWVAYTVGPPPASPQTAWVASRHLKRNTRLSAGDLQKPDFPTPLSGTGLPAVATFTGKYLTRERDQGKQVWPTDISDFPVIPPRQNTGVLFFPAAALGSARAYVNTGSEVLICEESKPCSGTTYTVESVLGGDSGAVAVRVPLADLDRIRAIAKPAVFVAAP